MTCTQNVTHSKWHSMYLKWIYLIVIWAQFCIGPVDRTIFFPSFFKGRVYTSLVSLTKVYYFSRKSLSKYLMDTIDFNKHDVNIFIILVKIVRYGRHWRDKSCNEWRLLFWRQLSESDEYFPFPIRHLNFQKIVEKCL
jgi:hypothetical protein